MYEVRGSVIAAFAVSAAVAILAPLALGIAVRVRLRASWRFWWLGVLVFFVFQCVLRVPLMILLQLLPGMQPLLKQPWAHWTLLAAAAFSAGLFEEGGRWLAFRFLAKPHQRIWKNGVMLGAGHGGLESMLVGLIILASMTAYILLPQLAGSLPAQYAQQVQGAVKEFAQLPAWKPLYGGWERLAALTLQTALSVMVVRSFTHGWRWWWLALTAHGLVDFNALAMLAVSTQQWGRGPAMLITQSWVTLTALAALAFLVVTCPRGAGRGEKAGAADMAGVGQPGPPSSM